MDRGSWNFDITKLDSGLIDLGGQQKLEKVVLSLVKKGKSSSQELDMFEVEDERLRVATNIGIATGLLGLYSEGDAVRRLQDILYKKGEFQFDDVREVSGIRYLASPGWVVVLLPNIKSVKQTYSIIRGLDDLVRTYGENRKWVVDFGSLGSFASNLLTYLVGIKRALELQGSQLLLLWIKKDHVPTPLLPSLINDFRLIKKGAYLISKSGE